MCTGRNGDIFSGVTLNTNETVVPNLGMSGAILPLPIYFHGVQMENFTFTVGVKRFLANFGVRKKEVMCVAETRKTEKGNAMLLMWNTHAEAHTSRLTSAVYTC